MRWHFVLAAALTAFLTSALPARAQAFVTADSITPSSGSGFEQTFVAHYTDSLGAADLGAWVWFHDPMAASTAPSCLLAYTAATNTLNLLDDSGTTWSQGTPGTLALIGNSRCRITLSESNATLQGTTLTLTVSMFFWPAFVGQKTVDMYAASSSGVNSGWGSRGSWMISCLTGIFPQWSLLPASGGNTATGPPALPGCTWTVSGGAPWVTATVGPFDGSDPVLMTVAANSAPASRRALFTVAAQPFWVLQKGTAPPVRGDFDGDGNVDLLWIAPSGAGALWLMDGPSVDLTLDYPGVGKSFTSFWSLAGVADFNHDGFLDELEQTDTGQLRIFYGGNGQGAEDVSDLTTDWKVVATADVNHDGWTDIIWQSPDGAVAAWLMNGINVVGRQPIYAGSSTWRVMAVDDFDQDGNPDIVWQSPAGAVVIWHLDAAGALRSADTVFTGTTDWKIVSTGDIDHDGSPDLIWQTPTGAVAVSYMHDTAIRSTQIIFAGPTDWRIVGPK